MNQSAEQSKESRTDARPERRWRRILRRLATFLAGVGGGQLLNLLTGFALLRLLSIPEYALYTVGVMLLGIANITSDVGLTAGLTSFGSPERGNRSYFGLLVNSAKGLRERQFVVASACTAGLLFVLARSRGWNVPEVVLLLVLVLAASWSQIRASLYVAVLNVHHDAAKYARSELWSGGVRCVLTLVACWFAPLAVVAVAASAVAFGVREWILRRSTREYVDASIAADSRIQAALRKFSRPLIPSVLFYAFQGQITALLLALLGTTTAIAELGAFSRIGQLLAVATAVNGFAIHPYFSRLPNDRVRREIVRLSCGIAILTISGIGAAALLPHVFLALIGPNYKHAPDGVLVLMLVLLSQALAVAAGVYYTILLARKKTTLQWINVLVSLLVQAGCLWFVAPSTVVNAAIMGLCLNLGALVVQLSLVSFHLARADNGRASLIEVPSVAGK